MMPFNFSPKIVYHIQIGPLWWQIKCSNLFSHQEIHHNLRRMHLIIFLNQDVPSSQMILGRRNHLLLKYIFIHNKIHDSINEINMPTPLAAILPHTITWPLPCLIVDPRHSGFIASSGFHQTIDAITAKHNELSFIHPQNLFQKLEWFVNMLFGEY